MEDFANFRGSQPSSEHHQLFTNLGPNASQKAFWQCLNYQNRSKRFRVMWPWRKSWSGSYKLAPLRVLSLTNASRLCHRMVFLVVHCFGARRRNMLKWLQDNYSNGALTRCLNNEEGASIMACQKPSKAHWPVLAVLVSERLSSVRFRELHASSTDWQFRVPPGVVHVDRVTPAAVDESLQLCSGSVPHAPSTPVNNQTKLHEISLQQQRSYSKEEKKSLQK